MARPIFLLQFVLAAILAAIGWKLAHTSRAPLESDRDAFTRLAWVDRSGAVLESIDLKGRYVRPRISPDGKIALLTRLEPGRADIWSLSVSSHAVRRLTAANKRSAFAVWSPGGDRYIFAFKGQLLQEAAGRDPEALHLGNIPDVDWLLANSLPEDWSADGRSIVFATADNGRPSEIFLLRTGAGEAVRFLKTKARAYEARFSKDGHWIALTSGRTGRNEVYVAPVPHDLAALPLPEQSLIRISEQGGYSPEWGPNGELLYIGASGDLMTAARADTGSPGAAQPLFRITSVGLPAYEYRFGGYSVGENGRRFLVALSARPNLSVRN
jgi:dipeptidyl aminopeptidase/acylaminoacyl peptidase